MRRLNKWQIAAIYLAHNGRMYKAATEARICHLRIAPAVKALHGLMSPECKRNCTTAQQPKGVVDEVLENLDDSGLSVKYIASLKTRIGEHLFEGQKKLESMGLGNKNCWAPKRQENGKFAWYEWFNGDPEQRWNELQGAGK